MCLYGRITAYAYDKGVCVLFRWVAMASGAHLRAFAPELDTAFRVPPVQPKGAQATLGYLGTPFWEWANLV